MIINLFFAASTIFFLYYGIKYKDEKERYIKFPITIGILSILFFAFRWFENTLGEVIIAIPLLLLIFGNDLWKKVFNRAVNR